MKSRFNVCATRLSLPDTNDHFMPDLIHLSAHAKAFCHNQFDIHNRCFLWSLSQDCAAGYSGVFCAVHDGANNGTLFMIIFLRCIAYSMSFAAGAKGCKRTRDICHIQRRLGKWQSIFSHSPKIDVPLGHGRNGTQFQIRAHFDYKIISIIPWSPLSR